MRVWSTTTRYTWHSSERGFREICRTVIELYATVIVIHTYIHIALLRRGGEFHRAKIHFCEIADGRSFWYVNEQKSLFPFGRDSPAFSRRVPSLPRRPFSFSRSRLSRREGRSQTFKYAAARWEQSNHCLHDRVVVVVIVDLPPPSLSTWNDDNADSEIPRNIFMWRAIERFWSRDCWRRKDYS